MAIITTITGILMLICGISCVFTPVAAFVGTEYMAVTITAIMMVVYGVIGIVNAAKTKEYGVNIIFSVLSVIAGAILFIPGMRLAAGAAALYIIAIWFILKGLVTVFLALNLKRVSDGKRWVFGVVIGIIGVLLGIYSFIHPVVLSAAIGLLIGIYLVETGVNMIIIGSKSA